MSSKQTMLNEKALGGDTNNARSQKFRPAADPLPWGAGRPKLISWRWSLSLPINRVWWGSMHAISSYRGNRPTNKQPQTHTQTGPITVHCAAASAQCSQYIK